MFLRLFQIVGRKELILRQVEPCLKALNHRDSFILDTVDKLFLWHGRDSSYRKRNKALHFCKLLNDEQGNSAQILVLGFLDHCFFI